MNEMLRARCNSGEEHQYHLDQMQNYLKSDIVWESKKEDLLIQLPKKPTLVYQSCQRDLKDPLMTLLNQYLFYLKYDNSGLKKYVPLLHRYLVVPFLENDLEELTSRWKRDNLDEVYLESKIVEVARTLYDLGHEHKYITEIVVRRADGKFGAFSESYYKYLNKNDFEDLYRMCINGKVKDFQEIRLLGLLIVLIRRCVILERVHDYQLGMESYQPKVNLTAPTITFPSIERKRLLTITSKPVKVLEMVKKFNMDVMHGYANPSLNDVDAEYMEFYEEYIEDCLKHRDQMRCWESYVNGRPLGSRMGRPE
ncbi:hypothetical protein Tco_0737587 [Tanacetum coccineum]